MSSIYVLFTHLQERVMSNEKVRLSLDVSPELNALLEELAREIEGNKSDVLRKAITLMDVAVQANKNNRKLLIADADVNVGSIQVQEIIGITPRHVSQ
jgi:hypothetical protein